MVNVQLRGPGPTLQDFIKQEDQICELNYRWTKCEIGAKVGDQKYNFTYLQLCIDHQSYWKEPDG